MEGLLGIMFPDAKRKQLENQIKREELSAYKRRSAAVQELSGLLANQPTGAVSGEAWSAPDVMRPSANLETQAGQQRLMGLLTQINPEAVSSGLLADKTPRMSTDVATMQQLGFPLTQAGYSQFKSTGNTLSATDQARLQQIQMQNEQMLADMEEARRTNTLDTNMAKLNTSQLLDEAQTAYNLANDLQGTWLETGQPFDVFRSALAGSSGALADVFGGGEQGSAKARQLRSKYELLEKSLSRLANNEAKRISGNGSPTDAARSSAASGMPSISMLPESIMKSLQVVVGGALDASDYMEFGFNRDKYQNILAPWSTIPRWDRLPQEKQAEIISIWPNLLPSEKRELQGR